MKAIDFLEKINNIDADLLEEAAETRAQGKWVRPLLGILAASLLLAIGTAAFVMITSAGNKTKTAAPSGSDYSSVGALYFPLSFEELVKGCDLLFVGTCTKAEPYVPSERAISFTFSVDKVLGGSYDPGTRLADGEIVLGFSISNPALDPADCETFKAGHQYLLPVSRVDVAFEPYYIFSPMLILDLTDENYRYDANTVEVPGGLTIEEYAVELFSSADHPEETRKSYADEFDEFYEESDFICRMRAVEVVVAKDGRTIALFECIEAYKGRAEDIYSFREDRLITIAVRTCTVIEGQEYILGFKAGNNKLSTKDAVKPVDEDLIQRILTRNSQK